MKKLLILFLIVIMICSMAARCEEVAAAEMTKEELVCASQPLTREEIDKSIANIAFAKSLIGNVYTFGGTVESIAEDHAVITFYIEDEKGNYATSEFVMVANLYLLSDELISLEAGQRIQFVGALNDVGSHEESIPDWGTETVVDMVFETAAVVSDRFEKTGTLHSQNTGYGEDAWNIKYPDNDYLSVVHFRDDVGSYKGQEITYSYKITDEGCVDAYIVE